ncbi:hypothetical protein, partial [Escherichia coli]|uniref:hypothetical protein n=1 Tax=Escherichia coli TaxID=562 RepID=UPI0024116531
QQLSLTRIVVKEKVFPCTLRKLQLFLPVVLPARQLFTPTRLFRPNTLPPLINRRSYRTTII